MIPATIAITPKRAKWCCRGRVCAGVGPLTCLAQASVHPTGMALCLLSYSGIYAARQNAGGP